MLGLRFVVLIVSCMIVGFAMGVYYADATPLAAWCGR